MSVYVAKDDDRLSKKFEGGKFVFSFYFTWIEIFWVLFCSGFGQ